MKNVCAVLFRNTLALALAFGMVVPGGAQSKDGRAKPSGGPQEGIKVRGHWVIEVRNPDGALVSRTEFENALTPSGGQFLAGSLARSYAPVRWQVSLQDNLNPDEGVCRLPGGVPLACVIGEGTQAPPLFGGLQVNVGGSISDQLILSGTATAMANESIRAVETRACIDQACLPTNRFRFTNHPLATPIPVVPGQIIQVTVTISFS